MRQVKARDGTVRDVADSYILANGESYVVALTMMDSRITVHDGHGRPAGQRPGFLYSNATNEQARVDAYMAYDADISSRWQSQRWQSQPSKPPPSKPPLVFDSQEAALADAHTQYRHDIEQRWRR